MTDFSSGDYQEIHTFTGETVWYDAATHVYRDEEGTKLVSASEYAERCQPEFPLLSIAGKVARKYDIDRDDVLDMWDRNGNISKTFGNALHLSMEQFFRHRGHGTEKNYHLPKPLYLRRAVESFPLREASIEPEVCVSDVKNRMVGRCDALLFEAGDPKAVSVLDFKSDADVEKNLDRHANQLSFYAAILQNKGWTVKGINIWNYVDAWHEYVLKQIKLKEII